MPLHDFKNDSGNIIECLVPKGTDTVDVDGVVYTKTNGPSGFAMVGKAVGIKPQKDQVKEGYYGLECKEGSRFLRQSTFSTKQIKKAWGF